MRTLQAVAATMTVAAALALGACAHTVHVGTVTDGSVTAVNAGTLTSTITYRQLGLTLKPPGARARAAITPDAALAVCDAPVYLCAIGKVRPTIQLALATTDSMSRINPDGTMTRTIDNRLVYAIVWRGVDCAPAGGAPMRSGAPVPSPKHYTCVMVSLVDAQTGQSLGAGQQATVTN
jgi:hypothetical protein